MSEVKLSPKLQRLENFLTNPDSEESKNYLADFLSDVLARPEEAFVHKFLDDPFWEELGYSVDSEVKFEARAGRTGRVEGTLQFEGVKIAVECKRPYNKKKGIESVNKLKGDDVQELENQIGPYLETHDFVIYTNGFFWFFYSQDSYHLWLENKDKPNNKLQPYFRDLTATDLFSKESPDFILNIFPREKILESFRSMENKFIRQRLSDDFFIDLKNWLKYLDESLSGLSKEHRKARAIGLINKLIFLRTMEAVNVIPSEYVSNNWTAKKGINTSVLNFINQLDTDFSENFNTELFLSPYLEDPNGNPIMKNGNRVENPDRKNNLAYESIPSEFFSALLRKLDGVNAKDPGMRTLTLNGHKHNIRSLYYWKFEKIGADILGKAYETYLAFERKKLGIYYTPHEMAEFLTTQSVSKIFDEKISKLKKEFSKDDWDFEKLRSLGNEIIDIKICDPSCGSGSFLIQAIRIVWAKYNELVKIISDIDTEIIKNKSTLDAHTSDKNLILRDFHEIVLKIDDKQQRIGSVILRHIFGNDKDPKAVSTAKLNIWMECLRLDPNTFKSEAIRGKRHVLPNLELNITHGDSLVDLDVEDIDGKLNEHDRGLIKTMFTLKAKYCEVFESTNNIHEAKLLSTSFRDNIIDPIFDEKFDEGDGAQIREILRPTYWQTQHFAAFYKENGELKNEEQRGFDVIVGNPPWEILEPDIDEFFGPIYNKDDLGKFSKLKPTPKKTAKKELLKKSGVESEWKKYNEQIELQQKYYKKLKLYKYQSVNESSSTNKIRPNFYKLFVEKYFSLLKKGGIAGIVLPATFNTNQGTRSLRNLLFEKSEILILFGFDNRKGIFDIHRQYKFINLIFKKKGSTSKFKSAFKIKDVENLQNLEKNALIYDIDLIKKSSPDSLTISETETQQDIDIIKKLLKFPLLSEPSDWKIHYQREFNKTDDQKLFNTVKVGSPMYGGEQIHQFDHKFKEPEFWIDTKKGTDDLRERQKNRVIKEIKKQTKKNTEIKLPKIEIDFDHYRLSWRDVTNETNTRTLICTILPPNIFSVYTLPYLRPNFFNGKNFEKSMSSETMLFLCGLFNSFIIDYYLRQRISIHATMSHMAEIPIPRYSSDDPHFSEIVEKVGSLICTTKDFDQLKNELKIKNVYKEYADRLNVTAQINAHVAKIYDLTREELEYVLGTFSSKNDDLKQKTREEFEKL